MSRLCALLLTLSLLGLAAAQEAPKPVPKGEEKKADPTAVPPKPSERAADKEELDIHKTAERIAENAQKAGDRLKAKDPGADTRTIQHEIVKDLDALIKKAQEPPPRDSDMNPMPPMGGGMGEPQQKGPMPMGGMGGAGGSPQSKTGQGGSGSGSKPGRRPRRERKPAGDSPMGMGDPMAKAGMGGLNPMAARPDPKDGTTGEKDGKPTADGDRFGKPAPRRPNDKLADLYKDVWGHLPDRLRQEMDLYYREKFMPRYSELLRQYYAALAEQKKSGSEDR